MQLTANEKNKRRLTTGGLWKVCVSWKNMFYLEILQRLWTRYSSEPSDLRVSRFRAFTVSRSDWRRCSNQMLINRSVCLSSLVLYAMARNEASSHHQKLQLSAWIYVFANQHLKAAIHIVCVIVTIRCTYAVAISIWCECWLPCFDRAMHYDISNTYMCKCGTENRFGCIAMQRVYAPFCGPLFMHLMYDTLLNAIFCSLACNLTRNDCYSNSTFDDLIASNGFFICQ